MAKLDDLNTSVRLMAIAGQAVVAATGEDIHTVMTFSELGHQVFIVTTKAGRSFRVMILASSQTGTLTEGSGETRKSSVFDWYDNGKIDFIKE